MINNLSSATARADRILYLRKMSGLSRDKLQQRYNIARGTLQNWESARFGGLTEKGAKILLRAYMAEGISCVLDWILHGIGSTPNFSDKDSAKISNGDNAQNKLIDNIPTPELLYFRKHNNNAIDMLVPDNCMRPKYRKGDYVAGIRYFRDDVNLLVGKDCIIQTIEYGTVLRRLELASNPGCYHLVATNINDLSVPGSWYNVEIISAAQVIWVRTSGLCIKASVPAQQPAAKYSVVY